MEECCKEENQDCKKCKCPCHMMVGIFIALVGVTFLLGNLEILSPEVVGYIWPSVLILLGLKKSIGHGRCPCCKDA